METIDTITVEDDVDTAETEATQPESIPTEPEEGTYTVECRCPDCGYTWTATLYEDDEQPQVKCPRCGYDQIEMVEDEIEQENVPPLEAITVPILALEAALACVSPKDDGRYYLQGVHVQARAGEIRISGYDGKALLAYSAPPDRDGPMPEWTKEGVTIPAAKLKARLSLLEESFSGMMTISYAKGASHLELADPKGYNTFKLFPVGGTFPDYQQGLLDKLKLGSRQTVDFESTALAVAYLKKINSLAALLDSKRVRFYGSGGEKDPVLIAFPGCPNALMLLAPVLEAGQVKAIGDGAARMISAATAGTIAALRAHRTRWEKKLEKAASAKTKKTIENKMAEYDERIAAIFNATQPAALPAPTPAVDETGAVVDESETEAPKHFDEHATDRAITWVPRAEWPAKVDAEADENETAEAAE